MQITEVVELVKRDKLPRDIGWLHARILKLAQMMYHLRLVFNDELVEYDKWSLRPLSRLTPEDKTRIEDSKFTAWYEQTGMAYKANKRAGISLRSHGIDPTVNKEVFLEIPLIDNKVRDICRQLDPKFNEISNFISLLRQSVRGRIISSQYPRIELLIKHGIRYAIWKEDLERTLRSMARMAK